MKIFAFFLPQFHTIPENDLWWGKGFTEWTNVKTAKPLFLGHKQPVHPLNNRYYNLLEKETVEWQTSLLHQYSIDGLIYYHYYFDGKLLLEQPAENLLKWKEINQPFFFCWANHPWRKTWNGSSEILMPLTYGDEAGWEKVYAANIQDYDEDDPIWKLLYFFVRADWDAVNEMKPKCIGKYLENIEIPRVPSDEEDDEEDEDE